MDRNFYKESFGIKDDRSLSADKGYYIAYLFSEDRKKVVLCISQPSKNITKLKNVSKLYYYYLKKNELIYDEIFKDSKYLRLPKPTLSYDNLLNARDFEASIIIYKEYNLTKDLSDFEFYYDLKEFMGIYSKLLDYIRAKKTVIIDSMRISLYTNAISEINKDIDYIEAIEDELIQNAAYKSQVYLS